MPNIINLNNIYTRKFPLLCNFFPYSAKYFLWGIWTYLIPRFKIFLSDYEPTYERNLCEVSYDKCIFKLVIFLPSDNGYNSYS